VFNRFLKPEIRYARRMARIARWDRPVTGLSGRVRAWAHMLLADHGVFRLFYLNKHQVTDRLWRSAQPAPHQIAALKAEGVRTIVNLRGGREHGSWQLQKEACERLGIRLEEFIVRSRGAPDRETLLSAKEFFDRIEYPAVLHCKSGADRAGIMSVLYMHFRKGRTIREALEQLSFRYLHIRHGKTGVLDYTFERYLEQGEPAGMSFLEWVESPMYDPAGMKADFRANMWGSLVTERLLKRE